MHACTWIHNPGLPVDSRYRYPVPGPDKNICKKQNGFDSTNGTVPGDCYLYCISPARTRTIQLFRSARLRTANTFWDETYHSLPGSPVPPPPQSLAIGRLSMMWTISR
jgi:hypothetical protein